MQQQLVGAQDAGAKRLRDGLGLRRRAGRQERVIVQQEQRGDHGWPSRAAPDRVRIFRGEDAEPPAERNQVPVTVLAAQLDRIRRVGPQLVIAWRPHHGREPLAQRSQCPFDIRGKLADIARYQQPVIAGPGAQARYDFSVLPERHVEVADGKQPPRRGA